MTRKTCAKRRSRIRSRQPQKPDSADKPRKDEEMRDFNDQARPPPSADQSRKELLKLIESLAYRHSKWQVFADFNEAAAISISNAVDLAHREERESRYMEIIKRYTKEELAKFPQMLAHLVEALEAEPGDVLGKLFHELELHNKWTGQFFTPYDLCRMMAKMTIGEPAELEAKMSERGFVRAAEPAAGSGAMVIALAQEMREAGINYQKHLHVTATDVDLKCVHMAYLQFALLHIPAVIIHGNSLSLEEYSRWFTPAHIMDGWNWKLRREAVAGETHEIEAAPQPEQRPENNPAGDDPPTGPAQLTLF
jgi:hypothetical protein